ncbi:MAG: hypothetical protein ABJJ69_19410 [Paracoccaceae bacterium]
MNNTREELKIASKELVDQVGLAAASRIGERLKNNLKRTYSHLDSDSKSFLSIEVVAALELASGSTVMTSKLAELAGYSITTAPEKFDPEQTLNDDITEICDRFSKLMQDYLAVADDAKILPNEAELLCSTIDELNAVLTHVKINFVTNSS